MNCFDGDLFVQRIMQVRNKPHLLSTVETQWVNNHHLMDSLSKQGVFTVISYAIVYLTSQ